MRPHLDRLRIREERAETSPVAFIKLAWQIFRNNKLETQDRAFEEVGIIFDLSQKASSLRKYKDTSITKADFKGDFSKAQTGFKRPQSEK